jgi:uncharacterized protein (DUF427 family)
MPKAVWNGRVIADSDRTIQLECNHYFPPESVRREYFAESKTHSRCPWKGTASYFDIVVDGKANRDGAWYYPAPAAAAAEIKDYVAFWHGVRVTP